MQPDDPANTPPEGESTPPGAPAAEAPAPAPGNAAYGKYQDLGSTPIPGDNPAGSRIVDWGELGREYFSKISSPTGGAISWPDVTTAALGMLGTAKDLRVALVATEALVRTQAIQGFIDGFGLLASLGENFAETMFPKREADRQNKALALEDFCLTWLEENRGSVPAGAGGIAAQASANISAAGQALAVPCGGEVVFPRLARAMASLAESLGGGAPAAAPAAAPAPAAPAGGEAAPAAPAASPNPASTPAGTDSAPAPAEGSAPQPTGTDGAAAAPSADPGAPAPAGVITPAAPPDSQPPTPPAQEREEDKAGPPGKYHSVGSTPISEEEPAGSKITNWGRLATEYFQKLSSPLGGAINWDSVRSAAIELLEQGKDLRVALVATSASMRTANLNGLSDGFDLLGVLSQTFGHDLHPRSPGDRYKKVVAFEEEAITWFEEKKGLLNIKAIEGLEALTVKASYAQEQLGKLCGGEPVLSRLVRMIKSRTDELKAEKKAAEEAPKAPAPAASASAGASSATGGGAASTSRGTAAANVPNKVESDKDANKVLAQAQRMLRTTAAHYREAHGGEPVTRRLERVAQWLPNVALPPNDFLERPAAEVIDKLQDEASKGKASIEELDKLTRTFPFWLAGQRLLFTQLEAEDRTAEATSVRAECAALAASLPGLAEVKFKDGEVVIDATTEAWLASAGGSGGVSMPSPDVSTVVDKKESKKRQKVRKEADKLAADKKLPEAIAKYQTAMSQTSSGRDRFLWKLELASFCFGHNPQIAKSLLDDLEVEVTRSNLGTWEPELAIVVYVELLKLCPEEETARMAELFGKLVLIDPQKAAQLQLPTAKVKPERSGSSGSSAKKSKKVKKENPDG